MYGRRHLQFMKVSNQEVEIRVHYSQQDNWIIPAPTLVRAGEGEEGWEKTGYLLMHESQASVLILVVPFFFLWVSFTVLMLSKCDSATTLKLTHTLPPLRVFWESSWLTTPRVSGPGTRSCQADKVLSLLCRDCLLSVLKAQESGGLSLHSMILLKAYKFFLCSSFSL